MNQASVSKYLHEPNIGRQLTDNYPWFDLLYNCIPQLKYSNNFQQLPCHIKYLAPEQCKKKYTLYLIKNAASHPKSQFLNKVNKQ